MTTSEPLDRKDASIAPSDDKRTAIFDAAIAVFAHDGYRHADVQVIADRAGVGKGTVYRQFSSKDELFVETSLEVCRRLSAALGVAVDSAETPLAKLRAAARAEAEFFVENADCLEVFVQQRATFPRRLPDRIGQYHRTHFFQPFVKTLEDAIASREIRPGDAEDMLMSLYAAMYGVIVYHRYLDDPRSLVDRVESAFEFFFQGMRPNQ